MPTNAQDVSKYLEFSLLQLGAESYLHDKDFSRQDDVVTAWKFGFNDGSHPFIIGRAGAAGSDAPVLPAYNRMVEDQAIDLFKAHVVIDHHANDATGFSATLYGKRQDPNNLASPIIEYTLSMRSTEARPWGVAGDAERDNEGANKQGIYDRINGSRESMVPETHIPQPPRRCADHNETDGSRGAYSSTATPLPRPRSHDEDDARLLRRQLDIRSYAVVVETIARYYPLERFPQKTLYALAELLPDV